MWNIERSFQSTVMGASPSSGAFPEHCNPVNFFGQLVNEKDVHMKIKALVLFLTVFLLAARTYGDESIPLTDCPVATPTEMWPNPNPHSWSWGCFVYLGALTPGEPGEHVYAGTTSIVQCDRCGSSYEPLATCQESKTVTYSTTMTTTLSMSTTFSTAFKAELNGEIASVSNETSVDQNFTAGMSLSGTAQYSDTQTIGFLNTAPGCSKWVLYLAGFKQSYTGTTNANFQLKRHWLCHTDAQHAANPDWNHLKPDWSVEGEHNGQVASHTWITYAGKSTTCDFTCAGDALNETCCGVSSTNTGPCNPTTW
jgi:hypothetical protein